MSQNVYKGTTKKKNIHLFGYAMQELVWAISIAIGLPLRFRRQSPANLPPTPPLRSTEDGRLSFYFNNCRHNKSYIRQLNLSSMINPNFFLGGCTSSSSFSKRKSGGSSRCTRFLLSQPSVFQKRKMDKRFSSICGSLFHKALFHKSSVVCGLILVLLFLTFSINK